MNAPDTLSLLDFASGDERAGFRLHAIGCTTGAPSTSGSGAFPPAATMRC